RFRAAAALAAYAPGDARWEGQGDAIVTRLLEANRRDPVGFGGWAESFAPVLPRFVPSLIRVYSDSGRDTIDRMGSSRLLSRHVKRTEDIALILQVAEPPDFETFFARLASHSDRARFVLIEALKKAPTPGSESSCSAAARAHAQAAIALARLEQKEP